MFGEVSKAESYLSSNVSAEPQMYHSYFKEGLKFVIPISTEPQMCHSYFKEGLKFVIPISTEPRMCQTYF